MNDTCATCGISYKDYMKLVGNRHIISELKQQLDEDMELSRVQSDALVELKRQNGILREALKRISTMDDSVYSKGAFCSKIAREALQRAGGEG